MRSRYPGDHEKFKSILNTEYEWPCEYMFKFIVPREALPQVEALFPQHSMTFRDSRNGNYVSATVFFKADCADIIIAIYERASKINGLIAL